MGSDNFAVAAAAAAAAIAAAIGLWYARAAAQAARDAAATARRTVELTELARRSAERAHLRHRVERVGQLVQEIYASSLVDPGFEGLSPTTRGQCSVLDEAVIGLKGLLPKSAEVHLATSPKELQGRARKAGVEIDTVLARMARRRPGERRRRGPGERFSASRGPRRY
jgi:hypothetical protein